MAEAGEYNKRPPGLNKRPPGLMAPPAAPGAAFRLSIDGEGEALAGLLELGSVNRGGADEASAAVAAAAVAQIVQQLEPVTGGAGAAEGGSVQAAMQVSEQLTCIHPVAAAHERHACT